MERDPICGMEINERSAFRLASGGKTHYFCSRHCLEKFASDNGIDALKTAQCLSHPHPPFYANKTLLVCAILALIILASYCIPFLEPFRKIFLLYVRTIWWAVAVGLLIGGIIDHYIPREYISFILAKPKKRTILYSVILGFLMSACSHGILALSIELHKKGASNPAVISFLLASPWANAAITIMLFGFFGLRALFIIISALVIALTTGAIFQVLERKGLIETNHNTVAVDEGFSIVRDIQRRLRERKFSFRALVADAQGVYRGSAALGAMVVWWILIGMGIASATGAYIPSGVLRHYMGPTITGLLVTLAAATLIEVCSEGSSPIAFEIFRQTGALGNSFVFLMAGVVTDYTEIGLLWSNVGRKVALWMPLVTVPQVVIAGFIANKFL